MQPRFFRCLVVIFLLSAPIPAAACVSTPEEERASFDKKDLDGDGFLTMREYYGESSFAEAQEKTELFARLDGDRDGRLNIDEYVEYPVKRCGG